MCLLIISPIGAVCAENNKDPSADPWGMPQATPVLLEAPPCTMQWVHVQLFEYISCTRQPNVMTKWSRRKRQSTAIVLGRVPLNKYRLCWRCTMMFFVSHMLVFKNRRHYVYIWTNEIDHNWTNMARKCRVLPHSNYVIFPFSFMILSPTIRTRYVFCRVRA